MCFIGNVVIYVFNFLSGLLRMCFDVHYIMAAQVLYSC